MHCHLLIPGLFPPFRPETRLAVQALHLPALTTLLARGNAKTLAANSMDAWLCQSFGVEKKYDWPVAACTLLADGGNPDKNFWLQAEPVHLQLQRDKLILADVGNLGISFEEAQSLTVSLNEHFASDGLHFVQTRPDRWHLRLDQIPSHLKTHPLETAIGRNIRNILPAGPDGVRWHSILNETQMLLHRHPVNEAREQRGLLPINSIWPWGGGMLPQRLSSDFSHVWANDSLTRGLALVSDTLCAGTPESATAWLQTNESISHHLIVLDTLQTAALHGNFEDWNENLLRLENNWFKPLHQALSNDHSSRLTLYTFNGGQTLSFSVNRANLWKIWLRRKSLETYFFEPRSTTPALK